MTTEDRIVLGIILAVITILLVGIFVQTYSIIDHQESQTVMLENIYDQSRVK